MKITRNNIQFIRSIVFLTCILSFIVHLSAGESVRIATYNLRNYLIMDRLVEGTWLKAYTTVDGFIVSPSLQNRVEKDSGQIWDTDDYYTGSDHRLVYFDLAVSE